MNISIDSNALTYLIDAIAPTYEPAEDNPSNYLQRVSMLRIFLYGGLECNVLPQVFREMGDISNSIKKELHESTSGILFHELTPQCSESDLNKRTKELFQKHPKQKDCKLLSEAEALGVDVLLTRDKKFRNRLNPLSSVEIIFPSDYLDSMNLTKDSNLKFCPAVSNPLSNKSWWKI